jgi:hypothetical protein
MIVQCADGQHCRLQDTRPRLTAPGAGGNCHRADGACAGVVTGTDGCAQALRH